MENDDKHFRQRYRLWLSAFIQVGFLAGATYGWANLEEILERDGYWTNDPSTEETNYGLVYTIGSWFSQAGRLFVGVYLDWFGVKVTTVTGCAMSCIGLVLFAVSNTGMNFVYPAFILISLGGPAVQLATQSVSNLFANKAMVMSSLTWAFQLSTLWFMLCNILNEDGVNENLLFMCYAGVAALLGLQCYLMYPKKFNTSKLLGGGGHGHSRKSMLITSGRYEADFLETGTLWQMMFSMDYIFLNMWYSFYILYLQFYVMTIGTQTELVTGENMAVEFTIALCTVSSSAILIGFAMDKFGFGIVVLCNIGFSMGASFCITSPETGVQWLGFILYVLSRVTTYGTFFAFIGINFGFKYFGTLAGIGLLLSGCFSLFQYLVLDIVENDMGGDYNAMNILMAVWVAAWGGLYAFWLFGQEVKSALKAADDTNPSAAPINSTDNQYDVVDNVGVKA